MSTSTSTPIYIELELELELKPADWDPLPQLPAALGSPTVDWSFNDQGKIETDVSLVIGDEVHTVSFWDSDQDGVVNTAEDTADKDPWDDLDPWRREAALEWGKEVHQRICAGVEVLVNQAAPHGSDSYRAIVAYASSTADGPGPS